ncbi:MAG: Holliday junction resolvase RuvX [Anaerolineae bacterium]|nr:Holliday junction resolvase RuvX [Anaerolineae bacterium]
MALDVGERRIGVAISDPLGLLARGLTTITRQTTAQAVAAIVALVDEWAPTTVVVGLPRNMDDTLGPQAEWVQAFARALEPHLSIPLVFWDERLSTVSASEILQGQGVRAKNQKGRLDAVAAAVILQDYLDTQRAEAGVTGLLPADAPIHQDDEPRRRGWDRASERGGRRRGRR